MKYGEILRDGVGMTAAGLAGLAIGIGVIYGYSALDPGETELETDFNRPDVRSMAKCTDLRLEIIDISKKLVRVSASSVIANGAVYEGTSYVLDDNKPSTTVPNHEPVTLDFADTPEVQSHEIMAVINYSLPDGEGVYGAIETCAETVNFK